MKKIITFNKIDFCAFYCDEIANFDGIIENRYNIFTFFFEIVNKPYIVRSSYKSDIKQLEDLFAKYTFTFKYGTSFIDTVNKNVITLVGERNYSKNKDYNLILINNKNNDEFNYIQITNAACIIRFDSNIETAEKCELIIEFKDTDMYSMFINDYDINIHKKEFERRNSSLYSKLYNKSFDEEPNEKIAPLTINGKSISVPNTYASCEIMSNKDDRYYDSYYKSLLMLASNKRITNFNTLIQKEFTIKDIKFNNIATIVFWESGDKTIVKRQSTERIHDVEKAIMAAYTKKILSFFNTSKEKSINNILYKWKNKYNSQRLKHLRSHKFEEENEEDKEK